MQQKHTIMGVHIDDRLREAVEVQKLLTANGQFIKTRLGLHEIEKSASAANGLLVLELAGTDEQTRQLADGLNGLAGVEAKVMTFEHPSRPE
jgi:hypothetical protein